MGGQYQNKFSRNRVGRCEIDSSASGKRLVPWFKEYTIEPGSSIQGKQLPKCGIVTFPRRKLRHAVRKIWVSATNISTEKLSSVCEYWTQQRHPYLQFLQCEWSFQITINFKWA